jgi:cytosine/adenosine deaminase-related metal-dependent hydrolase
MILIEGIYVITEEDNGNPVLLNPGFLGIKDDKISYIGKTRPKGYENAKLIKVENGLILPGFVDIHYHTDSPLTKGFIEDVGSINFYGSILYEHLTAIYAVTTEKDWESITRLTLLEMIKNGITTSVEFNSYFPEELAELLKETGLRGYIAPETNSLSGYPYSIDGKNLIIKEIDEAHAFDKLNRNLMLIEKLNGKNNDLIRVTLGPTEPPACKPELLKEVRKYAERYKVPITMHAAETIIEKNYIREKYDRTSIEYLDENGLTGPDVILGHAIYTKISDVKILDETKTNIAHCPTIFARRGRYLNSLNKYISMGINVGIGTDTFPQDMIEEMRMATICSKIADDDFTSAPSQMVYRCATANGAKALGRDDIGKLKVGNKADVIIVDLDDYNLVPTRDPIKVLVNCGSGGNVNATIVDGEILMQDRKLLKTSEEKIIKEAKTAAQNVWKKAKNIDKLSPLSVPIIR